jgi:hypothetical protein
MRKCIDRWDVLRPKGTSMQTLVYDEPHPHNFQRPSTSPLRVDSEVLANATDYKMHRPTWNTSIGFATGNTSKVFSTRDMAGETRLKFRKVCRVTLIPFPIPLSVPPSSPQPGRLFCSGAGFLLFHWSEACHRSILLTDWIVDMDIARTRYDNRN